MLWVDEARHRGRRMGVGVVVRYGRPASLAGGDDAEPHVRERGDGPGRPVDGHGNGPMQDHES